MVNKINSARRDRRSGRPSISPESQDPLLRTGLINVCFNTETLGSHWWSGGSRSLQAPDKLLMKVE